MSEGGLISQTISHYRVLAKLGAGGMGEVYLAEDIRLGRQVALKFLPASFQYDQSRSSRFIKEARAASALRSPNIAAIYDIGEHEGARFIVMEYVEGDLLSRRIERGPLPVREALDITAQVADALEEAHALGIVHRDIKSTNLIVSERGLVKVLDFGIAKMTGSQGTGEGDDLTMALGQQTAAGIVVGTVSYMSPEQALGRQVDSRSDIFSLGVVAYEMLTARLPFEGISATEIIDNILHQEPPPLDRFNYSAPLEMDRIIRKCLEKDRERRYQSTRELATDLRNFKRDTDSGVRTQVDVNRQTQSSRRSRSRRAVDSLAILPLTNASGDPDTEYLSDGITESIINNLSQLPKLRVMARSTVFRYKGGNVDPQEVGRELNVRAVLIGRLLERDDSLIIKVELVDTADGSHLWGEQYNRKMSDIFAVEEEISREISEKLRLKLSGAQKKQLTKRHTHNTEAYQLYLKGRFYWNRRTEEELKRGIEYFQRAISVDPGYALAYAGLADSYNILVSYSSLAPSDAFPKAKDAATRALELDEKLAEAHASLAFVRFGYDWDWAAAERESLRAIEINPGYAMIHLWYALFLAPLKRFDEAIAEINRALELDPLSLPINTNAGWIFHLARRYDEAIDQYRKTLDLDASFTIAHRRLGQAYEQKKMYEEALREFEKTLLLTGGDTETIAALGHLHGVMGRKDLAVEAVEKLAAIARTRYVPEYLVARIYIGLGDHDAAFKQLEKAYDERYGYLAYLTVDPIFDGLRADPRFAEMVSRVGLK